jgi:phosphatidylinositol 4-kinase
VGVIVEDMNRPVGPWDDLWEDKAQLIRRASPFELFDSYRLRPIIVKGGDDLRQEILAM